MEELINETKTGLRNEKTTSKPKIFNARASIIKTTKPSYANQALKQIPNAFCLESTSKSVLSSLESQNSDIAYESLQKKSEVMYKNVRNLPTEKIKTSVEVVYNRADNLYRMKVMRKTLSTWKEMYFSNLYRKSNLFIALSFWSKKSYNRVLKSWKSYKLTQNQHKSLVNYAHNLKLNSWRKEALVLWSEFKESNKLKREMLGKYHMKLLIKTIQYWKEFMIHRNSRKDQLVFVTKHHDNSLKLRALMSFSQHLVTKSGKIAAYRNAKNYRNHILLQKYARFLIGFYFHEQKYIKIRKQIQANQPVHSMTHHMHAWIKKYLTRNIAFLKCVTLRDKLKSRLKQKIVESWVFWVLKRQKESEKDRKYYQEIKDKADKRLLKGHFEDWIDGYRSGIAYKLMKNKADKICKIRLQKKYIKGFVFNKFLTRMKKSIIHDALNFYVKNLLRSGLSIFKEHHMLVDLKRRRLYTAIKYWSKSTYKKALKSWSVFTDYRKSKHQLEIHAKELYLENLRQETMTSWLKIGLRSKEHKESVLRGYSHQKEEKLWNSVKKYANVWLNKVRTKQIRRERLPVIPSKIQLFKTVNPGWMDHDPDKKSRRAPRRLENNGYISKTEVKPEEIKNDTKEFDLSLITRRPIRAASPFATSEKLMTPISHYKSNSAYNSPLTDRNQSAEDRVAEIEVKLLNLKFDKEKLQEFQHNLKANPDNRWLEKQIHELRSKLKHEIPHVKALYDELQFLKKL